MKALAKTLLIVAAAALAAAGLASCGERPQVVVYKQGKYQGKPDTPPWQDDPSQGYDVTSKWTKGDKASWENALKVRAQGQNEYTRLN